MGGMDFRVHRNTQPIHVVFKSAAADILCPRLYIQLTGLGPDTLQTGGCLWFKAFVSRPFLLMIQKSQYRGLCLDRIQICLQSNGTTAICGNSKMNFNLIFHDNLLPFNLLTITRYLLTFIAIF